MSDRELENLFVEYLEIRDALIEDSGEQLFALDKDEGAAINYPFDLHFPPGSVSLVRTQAITQAFFKVTILMAAIEAYARTYGQYPNSLDALRPRFYAEPLAPDPISGAAFGYAREGRGYVFVQRR